jgi:hypothetical protein
MSKIARLKTINQALQIVELTPYPNNAGKLYNVDCKEWARNRDERIAKLKELRRLAASGVLT